ncbi:hypothetical protein TCON_1425 [Astathelohania contejeani]|uniref:Guanylate cyclase domain-containing protein n=1 Tax=Astathelohania contejeani TaxID=164912 RepID=A0ABQ7HYX2_9MICR|nr:hypothetical protein TCON_1425 [Thelohania contejeani]
MNVLSYFEKREEFKKQTKIRTKPFSEAYPRLKDEFFQDFVITKSQDFCYIETKNKRTFYIEIKYSNDICQRDSFLICKSNYEEFIKLVNQFEHGLREMESVKSINFDYYIIIYEKKKSFEQLDSFESENNVKYVQTQKNLIKSNLKSTDEEVIITFFGKDAFNGIHGGTKKRIIGKTGISVIFMTYIVQILVFLFINYFKIFIFQGKNVYQWILLFLQICLFLLFNLKKIFFILVGILGWICTKISENTNDYSNMMQDAQRAGLISPSIETQYYIEANAQKLYFLFKLYFTTEKFRSRKRIESLNNLNFKVHNPKEPLNSSIIVFVKLERKKQRKKNGDLYFNGDLSTEDNAYVSYLNLLIYISKLFGAFLKENDYDSAVLVFSSSIKAVSFAMLFQNILMNKKVPLKKRIFRKDYLIRIGISRPRYGAIKKVGEDITSYKFFKGSHLNHAARLFSLNHFNGIVLCDNIYKELPYEFTKLCYYLGRPKLKGIPYGPVYIIL